MRFLQFVPLIIAWLPHVIAGIAVVESVASNGKSGAQKKEIVLDYLRATALRLGLSWGDQAVRAIDLLIDAAVTILNLLGIFKHEEEEALDVAEARRDAPILKVVEASLDDDALISFMERTRSK